METTEYGKILKKIRIDNNEVMRNMVEKLRLHGMNITVSYLSAIENGVRNIPSQMTEVIINEYNLNKDCQSELKNAEKQSQQKITIKLGGLNEPQKEVAFLFSKWLPKLTAKKICKIKELLSKEEVK